MYKTQQYVRKDDAFSHLHCPNMAKAICYKAAETLSHLYTFEFEKVTLWGGINDFECQLIKFLHIIYRLPLAMTKSEWVPFVLLLTTYNL